jgi:hypothetical protein
VIETCLTTTPRSIDQRVAAFADALVDAYLSLNCASQPAENARQACLPGAVVRMPSAPAVRSGREHVAVVQLYVLK